jgi:hypothetical protein
VRGTQDPEPPQGATSHNNSQQLENAPTGYPHQYINRGRDTRSIINSRHEERTAAEGYSAQDDSDSFLVFTRCFNLASYPDGFKLVGITKYDSKQASQQWIRCYSMAIEVLGGSNTTKVVYFPMALEPTPLMWLESL